MTTFIVAVGSPLPWPHNDSPARELQKFLLSDWMQLHLGHCRIDNSATNLLF